MMSDKASTKKPLWQSPAVYVATILSCLFLGFFYLAISNEPDYMPSQQNKTQQQAHSADTTAAKPSATQMGMTEQEHANMDNMTHDASAAHAH